MITTSAHIKSEINTTLRQNGLFWLGVATGASQNNIDPSEVYGTIGGGPQQRIHFKRSLDVNMVVNSIIVKHVDPASSLFNGDTSFNHSSYYLGLLNSSGFIKHENGKAIMTSYSINMAPQQAVSARFSHAIYQPDSIFRDHIEELNDPNSAPVGKGTEVVAFANEELPVMSDGQFFPGATSVSINSGIDLKPLPSPYGIYGFYYAMPFSIIVDIATYEKHFDQYQHFFRDTANLKDIQIGPFTLIGAKMTNNDKTVNTNSNKETSVSLVAKNFIFNP